MSCCAGCSSDPAMRKSGLLLLPLCWAVFAAYVWQSAAQLPERVATHFGLDGAPNGWMTRTDHVRFTVIMGIGSSAFVLAVFAFIRWCGDAGLNIPHKAYWLSPERRDGTYEFIQRQGVVFACLLVAFIASVHRAIVIANAQSSPALAGSEVGWMAGGFIAVTLLWVAIFIGRFYRRPA